MLEISQYEYSLQLNFDCLTNDGKLFQNLVVMTAPTVCKKGYKKDHMGTCRRVF